MMSKKQWLALLCIFMFYVLFGATTFYMIEQGEEQHKLSIKEKEKRIIEELLEKHYIPSTEEMKQEIFKRISGYCEKPLGMYDHVPDPNSHTVVTWTFYNSIFFVMTIVSTIGYGNLSPTTPFTRAFMIIFGIIGIPINGIVIITLGEFFGKSYLKIYKRWRSSKMEDAVQAIGLIGQIIIYALPGFGLFILIPSIIIMWYENWPYDLAIEFTFASLTTVGIGKHVPGTDANGHGEFAFVMYRSFLIIWLIMGLGYLAMIFGFITRGLRSKQMHKLEHKIVHNIKKTNRKIRQELRSILNEYLLMRVKPVYYRERRTNLIKNPCTRTQSCPDLRDNSTDSMKVKRRALSQVDKPEFSLTKHQSDTDLDRIDKENTFNNEGGASDQLLLRVVSALGNYDSIDSLSENYNNIQWINERASKRPLQKVRSISMQEKEPKPASTWFSNYIQMQELREKDKYGKTRSRTLPSIPKSESFLSKIKNTFWYQKTDGVENLEKEMNNNQVLEQTSLADFLRALNEDVSETKTILENNNIVKPIPSRVRRLPITPLAGRISFSRSSSQERQERRFSLCPPMYNAVDSKNNIVTWKIKRN